MTPRLRKNKKQITSKYPKMVCQHCNNKFQLKFDPKKQEYKLGLIVCPRCRKRPQKGK